MKHPGLLSKYKAIFLKMPPQSKNPPKRYTFWRIGNCCLFYSKTLTIASLFEKYLEIQIKK